MLIHTAKYEGLPNVLVEAQLLKNIISSDCPTDLKKFCLMVKHILFKNDDYKDL